MESVSRFFSSKQRRPSPTAYEPLQDSVTSLGISPSVVSTEATRSRFSWVEYCIFVLQGVAMLWAWNMFLAAAPYFQMRFRSSDWLLTHFQSSILSVSTVTNLAAVMLLTKLQRNASYPKRIVAALVLNLVCFTLLAISTTFYRGVSPGLYFAFLMVMVFIASLAAGLFQNGLFAFVSGFGFEGYTQGIMAGQGIAGIFPPIVEIAAVLSVPEDEAAGGSGNGSGSGQESPRAACIYFLTATGVSAAALLAFFWLARQHPDPAMAGRTVVQDAEDAEDAEQQQQEEVERKVVGMWDLFLKLKWLASGVAITFAVTMFYPVFTQEIVSVQPPPSSRLFQPICFIPLGFLMWNLGDLVGRVLPSIPGLNTITARLSPKMVFLSSLARVLFVPLYLLCNIRGHGAIIPSDLFYLFVVQFLFGVSNGYLGSVCMMSAPRLVDGSEREVAGGFMGFMLVLGLTMGSLLSFTAGLV